MTKFWLLAGLALLALGQISAQDAQCSCEAIEQAKQKIEAELTTAKSHSAGWAAAAKRCEADAGKKHEEALQKVEELTKLAHEATTSRETSRGEMRALESKLDAMRQELEETRKELEAAQLLAAKAGFNATALLLSTRDQMQAGAMLAFGEAKLVFEELKQGKTQRLAALGFRAYVAVESFTRQGFSCVAKLADEHLPEGVKRQMAGVWARVSDAWTHNVMEAAWAKEVVKRVGVANNELKDFVTVTLKKQPSLAHLADPVYVQLIVYGIICFPLLLLLLPLILLLAPGGSSSASKESNSASKKKRKPFSKPAAVNGRM